MRLKGVDFRVFYNYFDIFRVGDLIYLILVVYDDFRFFIVSLLDGIII